MSITRRTFVLAATGALGAVVLGGCAIPVTVPVGPPATTTGSTSPDPDPPPAGGSSSTSSPSSPGNGALGVGQQFGVNHINTLLITVKDPQVWSTPTQKRGKPPVNGRYVTVTVVIEADPGAGAVLSDNPSALNVNALDFYIIDGTGQRYTYGDGNTIGSVNMDKQLHHTQLNPGEKLSGTLSFDVPPGVRLAYAPDHRVLRYWVIA